MRFTPVLALVGDSTVTDHEGWGLGFQQSLRGVRCHNFAQCGSSTKTFRADGHWEAVLQLRPNYILIQFGHNDMLGKGPKLETEPTTTFPANLERYVVEMLAIQALPILVTSLTRRKPGPDGVLGSELLPYARAARRVAAAHSIPVIDLHATSIAVIQNMDPAATAKLEPHNPDGSVDRTHLNSHGSRLFGRIVAEELCRVVPTFRNHLRIRGRDSVESPPAKIDRSLWREDLLSFDEAIVR